MKRLLLCGVIIIGLPLVGGTVQIGSCTTDINEGGPTFWQSVKLVWKISKWSGCGA